MKNSKLILTYGIHQFLNWFIVGIFIPVMTLQFQEKGLNFIQIGYLFFGWGLTIVLVELPTGGLADAIGRKRIFLIGHSFIFASVIVLLFSWNFITVLAGFCLMALSRAISSGSLDAWFVDSFTEEKQGDLQRALSYIGAITSAGLGLGSILGGLLPVYFGLFNVYVPRFDRFAGNLLAMLFIIILLFFYTFYFIKEDRRFYKDYNVLDGFMKFPEIVATSIKYGIKTRTLFLILLSSLIFKLGFNGLEMFWQPKLKSLLQSENQIWILGVASTGYFFVSSIGQLLSTIICKILNYRYALILFISRLLTGFFYFFIAVQMDRLSFIVFYWLIFAVFGIQSSPYLTVFNQKVPESQRSTLLSFESLLSRFGVLLGAVLMGYIAENYSIANAWTIGAIIVTASSVCFLFLKIEKQ
ncbi:MAG: MFS transporter [Spirochaetes bacterium]|nr:MFS transporter [Spirochaetota bacterium]